MFDLDEADLPIKKGTSLYTLIDLFEEKRSDYL